MNLLSKLSSSDVKKEPFPYLAVENVLPEDLCNRLVEEFPKDELMTNYSSSKENTRFDLSIHDAKPNTLTPLWNEFLKDNSSKAFFEDLKRIFGSLPDVEFQDASASINSPLEKPSSVRTAHVDDPLKIYSGLFYLRGEEDDSKGGDLIIYKYKTKKPRFVSQQINMDDVEEVGTIPYRKNTLVIFPSTFYSVHGVSPRLPTSHTRKFVNLYGDGFKPHFDLTPYRGNKLTRFIHRTAKKVGLDFTGIEQRK